MGSLTSRGRALVVVAFVLSAALCGSAAVALVVASRDDAASPSALPTVNPTLIAPSQSPTPSPAPASATPTPSASPRAAVTATPKPTTAATSSPAPRTTTSPRPRATQTTQARGLYASAEINIADGGTTEDLYRLTSHATDGDGSISLRSLDWGDGTALVKGGRGATCTPPAVPPADCRDFTWTHTYAAPGSYEIVVVLQSEGEVSQLKLTVKVSAAP